MRSLAKLCVLILALGTASSAARGAETVAEVMDDLVTRIYDTMDQKKRYELNDAAIQKILTPEERKILATRHVHFEVDVPVVVSVMHNTGQAVAPFWLAEAGFEKTDLLVTNTENWEYAVWQKEFEAGRVGLGINGFDNHRQHYFVSVGPRDEGDKVEIENLVPNEFSVGWMHEGAFVYNDWDSLLLKEVPRELRRHRLLTTIRGRARAAHLIHGFRKTPYPSSVQPDQVVLTWSEDPTTTQSIQWRTSAEVEDGTVRYKKKGASVFTEFKATGETIENRLLSNDRYCKHFTAVLTGLEPSTEYLYTVGSASDRSEEADFVTAPADDRPFSFITFGDTHNRQEWGRLLERAQARHPDAAFHAIAGDLVNTGQYRDDWDQLFHAGRNVLNRRPLVPTIGNHDAIDGLGVGLYKALMALPENGPKNIEPERAFSFEYGNMLFLVPDSCLPVLDQAEWMEEQLANTDATWKFAMFHFPPYNYEEPYPEIKSLWGYLFDKYHVDFALEGHIHYYMRSFPMFQDEPKTSPADGTIHVLSIGIPARQHDLPPADYAALQFTGVQLYQHFEIDGNKLRYRAYDFEGEIRDEIVIEK